MEKINYTALLEKWAPVLNEENSAPLADGWKRKVTAALLENQEKDAVQQAIHEQYGMLAEASPTVTADVAKFDPVLISLVRRSLPNLMAYDVASVQPMNGPTSIIFALKSKYKTTRNGVTSGDEALFNETQTGFTGDSATTQNADPSGLAAANFDSDSSADDAREVLNFAAGGMETATAEGLGDGTGSDFAEMGMSIDKSTVTAKSRAVKAEYTVELAQDMQAIHGLDAGTELANILSTQVLADMNREIIRTINAQAKSGGALTSTGAASADFDLNTDADGRWSVEKFKGLIFQIERDRNAIAKETRMGRGNFIICSSNVASALVAAGMLDHTPALAGNNGLSTDDTGNTFAGVLNGNLKVYIDPYAGVDYVTVGYKGSNQYDAGLFYCPYVPLTMMKAQGENTFQPKIGFKTRYGLISNPFVGNTPANGLAAAKTNQYYRIFRVKNILGS